MRSEAGRSHLSLDLIGRLFCYGRLDMRERCRMFDVATNDDHIDSSASPHYSFWPAAARPHATARRVVWAGARRDPLPFLMR